MTTLAADSFPATSPKWSLWAGRALSALVVFALAASAAMKFTHAPQMLANLGRFGFEEGSLNVLGTLELASVLVYLIPQTRVLGAILITGYLGGAVATHVRIHDPFFIPLTLGVFAWAGLYLRDARLRALLLR